MSKNDGPLSATYWNPIIKDFRTWVIETRENLLREAYASGYPLGTEPNTRVEQYQTLIALKQSGNAEFWSSQEAQDELRKLEEEFGPAPALTPTPMPPQMPMQPGVMPNGGA